MMLSSSSSLWCLWLLVVTTGVTAAAEQLDHEYAQVEWVKSKGGHWSDKLEFQRLDPNDPKSPRGVFAKQDIVKGESLIIIPRSCLLTVPGSEQQCDTTNKLLEEYKLGDKSDFAPYVQYVFSSKRGTLPSRWSPEGQALLRKIAGRDTGPDQLMDLSYEDDCGGYKAELGSPELQEDAHAMVHSRAWDDKMIPLYDMINHRSGKWSNIESNSVHGKHDVFLFAHRDIAQGEQILYSYYGCTDCQEFAHNYGLQEILRDFGFLEQYPQRWILWRGRKKRVIYDVDEGEDGALFAEFPMWYPVPPQIREMKVHLKGLESLQSSFTKDAQALKSEHERSVLLQFYKDMKAGLALAIEVAEEHVKEMKEAADDNEQEL